MAFQSVFVSSLLLSLHSASAYIDPSGAAGQGKPKVPPKQIGVKTARKFMKEVLANLLEPAAKEALEEAKTAAAEKGAAFLTPISPVFETIMSGLVEQYKFQGGFPQAMDSVRAAQRRKGDKDIQESMNQFLVLCGAPAEMLEQTRKEL
mmetsp:Transcript_46033/g.81673  ORF Transcript_46033/g.81673 Transcript_46033/m.81673 type:complete len:149 (+) Transcript_46033:44-490(+)